MLRFASACFALVLLTPAGLAQTAYPDFPTVSARGTGTVTAAPDAALVSLLVSGTGADAGRAVAAYEVALAEFETAVRALGVDEVQPQSLAISGPGNEPYGYNNQFVDPAKPFRAASTVLLTVDDPDGVPDLIETLFASGVDRVVGVAYLVLDGAAAEDEALAEAMARARQKAEAFAAAAGVELGAVASVTEESAYGPGVAYQNAASFLNSQTGSYVPVQTEFGVSVRVTYAVSLQRQR